MCDTSLDSKSLSFLVSSPSQSFTHTPKSSNKGNDILELSHPPLSIFDYNDFSPISSWNEIASVEKENDEQEPSDFSEQFSELSLETSPSLRSVHLPTNQRVSSLYYSMSLIHNLALSPKNQIVSAVYSGRAQKFIILDHAGIIAWYPESNQLKRVYFYPAYKHNLFLELSYSSRYNVYFVLTKTRAILTFNSHFEQVNSTRCFENSLLHLIFLESKSILIGAGVNGVSFWTYKRIDLKTQGTRVKSLKPMENYILYPTGLTQIPENKLIRKITISHEKRWIFALSFYDVYAISFEGKLVKSFLGLHKQTITDCLYNLHYSFLLTVSTDSTLTLWSDSGFPIHIFNSAMKSNTAVIQHPLSPHLVLVATVKGFVKCYNLFTLEEEFTQYIMEYPIMKIDSFEMLKQNVFYAVTKQSISLLDLNYFCEFWGPLGNTPTSICFYRSGHKSERFHALCQDGTIRLYSIPEARPLSVVLPPPDISFPTSSGSVAYDRNTNLLYILLGPQEIWVYTAKTHPACRLEVYTRDIMWSILSPRDVETGNFVATGISSHSFIPHCTCLHVLPTTVSFTAHDGSHRSSDCNLLMLGLKDGRILFVTINQDFSKLFEMQASVGEVVSLQFLESNQILSQSVSVGGYMIKIWSLPDLGLVHSLELHSTLMVFWKVQDILLAGFSDGTLSLSFLKGMGSSFGGRSEVEERDRTDEIVSIHGIDRFNLFCTAQKSGVVKIWDHHKNLIKIITLNGSLSGAYFLNTSGDLLVSLNRHFYIIKQEYVLSSVSFIQAADNTQQANVLALTDSAIFEDPNCKNGRLVASKHGFYYVDTMESYLKPYDINLHGPNGLAILDQMLEVNAQNSESPSLSQSSTETISALTSQFYLSDTQTPLVLSFDNFPLPIFSTPTATPRATPPPAEKEIDEREAIRNKLSSMKECDLQDPPVISQDSVVEQIKDIPTAKSEVVAISQIKDKPPLSREIPPKGDLKLPVRRLQQIATTKKSDFISTPDTTNPELNQPQIPSIEIPLNANIKTRVLKQRRVVRRANGNSEILANLDGVNYIPPKSEEENTIVDDPVPSLEDRALGKDWAIREVVPIVRRGLIRNTNSSIYDTNKYLSHDDTDEAKETYSSIVDKSQGMNELVNFVGSGICTLSKDDHKLTEMKNRFSKAFPLNNPDFSTGWQDREYVRRLSYRTKQSERFGKVRAYQANLRMNNSVRRAKFNSKSASSLHQYPTITLNELLEMVKCRDEVSQTQSRVSTLFLPTPVHPPGTPVSTTGRAYSTSSFYAYKINLETQTNFRLSSKRDVKVNGRVPPNSRCTSAPLISNHHRYDL